MGGEEEHSSSFLHFLSHGFLVDLLRLRLGFLAGLPRQRLGFLIGLLRLKEIAAQEQVTCLPVYERQEGYLSTAQRAAGRPFEVKMMLTLKLILRRYLLRQTFDRISEQNGFLLVTDGMHMNSRGAALIANEIESFLRTTT